MTQQQSVEGLAVVEEVSNSQLDRLMPGEKVTMRQLLTKTAEILDDPAKWTTGALARDANGSSVDPNDPRATCFCAIGATYRAYGELVGKAPKATTLEDRKVLRILQRVMQSASHMLVGTRVENLNDNAHGRENLQRLMPLSLEIIEYATQVANKGALGEPVGAVTVVPSWSQEAEHIDNLESQNEPENFPGMTGEVAAADSTDDPWLGELEQAKGEAEAEDKVLNQSDWNDVPSTGDPSTN